MPYMYNNSVENFISNWKLLITQIFYFSKCILQRNLNQVHLINLLLQCICKGSYFKLKPLMYGQLKLDHTLSSSNLLLLYHGDGGESTKVLPCVAKSVTSSGPAMILFSTQDDKRKTKI